jgi:AcrR family transcriptional regulator
MEDAEKAMRYPAKETALKHERIVKDASRLFRERGFENVSMGEAMKAAALTHGAVLCPFRFEGRTESGPPRHRSLQNE